MALVRTLRRAHISCCRHTSRLFAATTHAARAGRGNPFHLEEKKKWDRSRFGKLENTTLATVKEDTMHWPKAFTKSVVSCKDVALTYRMVDVDKEAEQVASIYQRAIDEIVGNGEYEWHHRPGEIKANVDSGKYLIWGAYDSERTLMGVMSTEFVYGQREVHLIWGAVDPDHRGKGVWENLGVFLDEMIEQSGAQYGSVWAATTHDLTQRMMEKAGWKPVGCFVGGEWLGGSDGQYYRQTVIWYSKVFGAAVQHIQHPQDMVLTDAAARVVVAVMDEDDEHAEDLL